MTTNAITHLNFTDGKAREALNFYADVFAGDVLVHTYEEFGMPASAPDAARLAYGQVAADSGFLIMAYDIPSTQSDTISGDATFVRRERGVTFTNQPSFVSLRAGSLDEVQSLWDKLVVDGDVVETLSASNWSAGFGMLTDKFGVTWILNVHQEVLQSA
jgi:PhnB protein